MHRCQGNNGDGESPAVAGGEEKKCLMPPGPLEVPIPLTGARGAGSRRALRYAPSAVSRTGTTARRIRVESHALNF